MVAKDSESYRRGNEIIVRSNRGIETGLVLCEATEDALEHLDQPPVGHILRVMSDDDANELARIEQTRDDKLAKCQNCLLYTSPSPRDLSTSRMPSSA